MDLISILLGNASSLIQVFKKKDKPILGFKHLILKNDDHVENILKFDFSFLDNVTSQRTFLIENEVFNFGQQYFRRAVQKEYHKNWEESPFNELAREQEGEFTKHFYLDDLERIILNDDQNVSGNIVNELRAQEYSFELEDFARHQVYDFHCHGTIHEVKEFRQMWLVVLWIENISQDPIPLQKVVGTFYENNQEMDFRGLHDNHGLSRKLEYPSNQMKPGESILLPEFFLLPPLKKDPKSEIKEIEGLHWGDVSRTFNYAALSIKDVSDYQIIGPSFKPHKINSKDEDIDVHELDLNNLITINEHLNFGSCPYVFGFTPNNKIEFLGDILTTNYVKINIKKYSKVFICELEKETTVINEIVGDNKLLKSDIVLNQGDSIVLENPNLRINFIEIHGYYIAERPYEDSISNFSYKHNLIMNKITELSS